MNRSLLRTSLIALATVLSITPVLATDGAGKPTDVIATVNGKTIPKSRADALINAQTAQGQPDSPELRKMVREELIRREILTQEAVKKGFERKSELLPQLMLARQGVLINAYVGDYVRAHPVTDEVLKKEYDLIKQQLGDKEYKVRHILVEKEDEAKDIIARLQKAEKFEDLAKQSKDPGSKDKGGDLGWAAPSNFVKPFSAAMIALEKNKFSETPVKSDFGFHVIMLDDTRELKLPSFDEAKQQLAQRLQTQIVEKHIAELRKASNIK